MHYQEIEGDLIKLAQQGTFEVITHGCNCMCTMGAGIAPQMAKAFGADKFVMECEEYRGDINKLGSIDYKRVAIGHGLGLAVVNAYTQYNYGRNHIDGDIAPFDYVAFTLCMRKMNHIFKGKHIGMPKIGAGLAGGDWELIHQIIVRELKDCIVTVVIYKPE
jgi:O-acetyl-ADP-ribose deacetylase (regulator of RNase III)